MRHFQRLAEASPDPLVIYNVPYRTSRYLGSAAMVRLAATANIAGVKHAVGGIDQDTIELLRDLPAGFPVLCGDDASSSRCCAWAPAAGSSRRRT